MNSYPEIISLLLAEVAVIGLTVFIAVQHIIRGGESILYGIATLFIFFYAGLVTNLFNYVRHESKRQRQRPPIRKGRKILSCIAPGWSTLSWILAWLRTPTSWSAEYWVSVLQLFQGALRDLPQAVLQAYLILRFYWEQNINLYDTYALAISAFLLGVWGIITYIRKEFYEEEHQRLGKCDAAVILFALIIYLGGRAVLLSMAGALISFWLMACGFLIILLVNYLISLCLYKSESWTKKLLHTLPIALLHAMCLSKWKALTVMNTVFWLCLSFPQIVQYNTTIAQWLMWGGPFFGQVFGLSLLFFKWRVVEIAFRRFERLLTGLASSKTTDLSV